jgi:hypothetical protein
MAGHNNFLDVRHIYIVCKLLEYDFFWGSSTPEYVLSADEQHIQSLLQNVK